MIDVYDLVNLCIDDSIILNIYDNESERVVWSGPASDLPDEYGNMMVDSFDPPEEKYALTVSVSIERE